MIVEKNYCIKHQFACFCSSLWDDFQNGLKIESGRTPLIIRFLENKDNYLIKISREGVPLSKFFEKGKPG